MRLSGWRLTKTRYAESAFDGEGARRTGGRWNRIGTSVVYAADSAALALLEILVHLEVSMRLRSYSLIRFEVEDALVEELDPAGLPSDWTSGEIPRSTQRLGDRWVEEERSLVLRVPSVVVPVEHNLVINPRHPEFPSIQVEEPITFPIDSRLLRS